MRIGITDSGVGELSVCAELEARLRQSPVKEDIEVIYLNAAIEDDYSYNSMPDRQTKLQAFVPRVRMLNPNRGAVDTILSRLKTEPGHGVLTIEFMSRYNIPDVAISSLSAYIGERAPDTLSALKGFTCLPELCGEL